MSAVRATTSLFCAAIAALVLLLAPEAGAGVPSSYPAAGPLVWPSVAARSAPRPTARRVHLYRELRLDYRPQIVLALGVRRIGGAPAQRATLTLRNMTGGPALELSARDAGEAGNGFAVAVRHVGPGQDEFTLLVSGTPVTSVVYGEGDIGGLAGYINANSRVATARALSAGTPLAPVNGAPFAGGRNANPGQAWYRVSLPIRPFGRTGWIPAESVAVRPTIRQVVVRRGARVLDVYRGARRIFRAPVAVGRPDRPTPLGRFYVAAKYVPRRNALVSTYALELSAPAGLPDFLRGGVVGIHGTPATSSIGRRASNGCIRVTPASARALRRIVPLGTPVRIVR